VQQYTEKRIKTADRQELEEEAEQKEKQELYDPETYITVNYHNRKIRLTKRQYEKLLEKTAEVMMKENMCVDNKGTNVLTE